VGRERLRFFLDLDGTRLLRIARLRGIAVTLDAFGGRAGDIEVGDRIDRAYGAEDASIYLLSPLPCSVRRATGGLPDSKF